MFFKKHKITIFFIAWFVLNVIQAFYTELFDDEAYYWVFSKFLEWGYFDHPPAIAVLIRAGYGLMQNELGVRLITLTISTLTLVFIHRMLKNRNDKLFLTIVSSIALLQLLGILAVPDIPLCFFTALFFLIYKQFINKASLLNSILLGVVMSLMLYSKYHGILIILLTFLSNPGLAKKYHAYIAVITGTVLVAPHLYWQYTHDFPSFWYHFFERNADRYKIIFTVEYIIGQILIAGPLMGWLLLWSAFNHRYTNLYEKALKFSMAGFYLFFLLSTFKGRVEANWTSPLIVPIIVLSHQYLINKPVLQRMLLKSLPVTLFLVAAMRIYMIAPPMHLPKDEFHQNKKWAQSIYEKTDGLPAVFLNSYQRAAKYWFYAGVPGHSLNTPTYRRNNYNIFPIEDSLNGKRVTVIQHARNFGFTDSIVTVKGTVGVLIADSFFSFSKVKIIAPRTISVINGIVQTQLDVTLPKHYRDLFRSGRMRQKTIDLSVVKDDKIVGVFATNIKLSMLVAPEQTISTVFAVKLPAGEYTAAFSLPTSLPVAASLNSNSIKLMVQ